MLKNLVFVIIALLLGFIGLNFVFSDLSSSESWISRVLIASLFFFLSGLGIGFFNSKAWLISGLTAWGGILMGIFIVFGAIRKYGSDAFGAQEPPYISAGLIMLLLPLGLALAGGYVGKSLGKKP